MFYAFDARFPGTMFMELNATGGSFQAFPGTEAVVKCGMRLHSNNRIIGLDRAQEERRYTVAFTRSGEYGAQSSSKIIVTNPWVSK